MARFRILVSDQDLNIKCTDLNGYPPVLVLCKKLKIIKVTTTTTRISLPSLDFCQKVVSVQWMMMMMKTKNKQIRLNLQRKKKELVFAKANICPTPLPGLELPELEWGRPILLASYGYFNLSNLDNLMRLLEDYRIILNGKPQYFVLFFCDLLKRFQFLK